MMIRSIDGAFEVWDDWLRFQRINLVEKLEN